MILLEIDKDEGGRRNNQICDIMPVPDGYLAVPSELEKEAMAYLPFIEITIEDGVITAVAQGEIPEPIPPEPQPDPLREMEEAIVEIAALVSDTVNAVTELAAIIGGDM
jgi:hypothetical protein